MGCMVDAADREVRTGARWQNYSLSVVRAGITAVSIPRVVLVI